MFINLLRRYILRQLTLSFLAVTTVLLLVSLSGVFADLVSEIARGRVPAPLLLTQLGLRFVAWLPLILPLALFIGLIMGIGRLYRDSEMAVLSAVGIGPRQILLPVLLLAVPVSAVVGLAAIWLGPLAEQTARLHVDQANRNFLVAGLDAGRFMELPGGNGVVYVGDISPDGRFFDRLFVQRDQDGRIDLTTATSGELFVQDQARFLRMNSGFRVEGVLGAGDFRLQSFGLNEIRLPDPDASRSDPLAGREMESLIGPGATNRSRAEWHWRIGVPIISLILAVLAVPLARSPPRKARYGLLMLAVLAYILGVSLLILGKIWLGAGKIPIDAGLWWLHLPAMIVAVIALARDGRLPRRRSA